MMLNNRIFLWCLISSLVLFVAETGSFLTLSLIRHDWALPGDLDAQKLAVLSFASPKLAGPNTDTQSFFGGYPTYLHPYLGFTITPRTDLPEAGGLVPIEAFGFAPGGGSMIRKRSHDDLIIGILGGSVAQNFVIGKHGVQALTRALQRDTRFRDKKIHYTSMALGGYKEPQHLLALNYFLSLGAQFDIVINLSGFNEVTLPFRENLPAGLHPLYPRSWQLLAGNLSRDQLTAIGRIALLRDKRVRLATLSNMHPCNWSFSCGLAWYVLDSRMGRHIGQINQDIVLADGTNATDPMFAGPPIAIGATGAVLKEIVSTWERGAMLIEELGRGHGFSTFTFLQPSPYYGTKPLSLEEKNILLPGSWADVYTRRGYPSLQDAVRRLQDHGYHALDLVDIFQDHPETMYVDSCCHFGKNGDEIIAERIAVELLR